MFTIGSDPEFILKQNGNFFSAIKKLPSINKAIIKNKNKFYYDNVLVEIQIKESKNKKEFITNIKNALSDLLNICNPLQVCDNSSAEFLNSELSHPDARQIGCNPEYCAYELSIIEQPIQIIQNTGFRSAGGHIHLGSKLLFENSLNVIHAVRLLDLIIGIPSIFLDKTIGSEQRKKIYGKAGSHRLKDYGLEYRTLSNFWFFSPDLCFFIYDACEFVINFIKEKLYTNLWTVDEDILLNHDNPNKAFKCHAFDTKKLRNSINNNDKKLAKDFINVIKKITPQSLYNQIKDLNDIKFDIKKNWDLF